MSLTRLAIKIAVPKAKITNYDRYLFVGPHPDDIEIGAGGLISKLVKMGKKISLVICTDGRFGMENCPGKNEEELAEIRKQEALASAKILGVSEENVYFLGFSDGGFYDKKEMEYAIAKVLGKTKPEMVFCPDPLTKNECHKDHLVIGDVVRKVSYFSPFYIIMEKYGTEKVDFKAIAFYMTDKPNQIVKISSKDFENQMKAIFECHLSQYPKNCSATSALQTYLKIKSFDLGIRKCTLHAEGYRVLDITRMHCLPEG